MTDKERRSFIDAAKSMLYGMAGHDMEAVLRAFTAAMSTRTPPSSCTPHSAARRATWAAR